MWIKIDSNLLDWRWFSQPNTLAVWVYLLLKANYKDRAIGAYTIHRGEVFVSQEQIAQDTGLTRKQVRTALDHLLETGEIRANRKIGKAVVISIPKYNDYQGEGPIKGQKRANKGPDLQKGQNIENLSPPYNPPTKPYSVPTLDEVREYERTSSKGKDPDSFFRHYSGLDWNAGGHRIYDWRKLYDRWEAPEPIKRASGERVSTFTDADGFTYTLIDGDYKITKRPN